MFSKYLFTKSMIKIMMIWNYSIQDSCDHVMMMIVRKNLCNLLAVGWFQFFELIKLFVLRDLSLNYLTLFGFCR